MSVCQRRYRHSIAIGVVVLLIGCSDSRDVDSRRQRDNPPIAVVQPENDEAIVDPAESSEPRGPRPDGVPQPNGLAPSENVPITAPPAMGDSSMISEPIAAAAPTEALEDSREDPPSAQAISSEHDPNIKPVPAAEIEEAANSDEPSFRLLLPTTSGPLVIDVEIQIGDQPLAAAYQNRIQAVMQEAGGSSELTWTKLFNHVSSDPQQFGRSTFNAQQHRNLIRLYDRNHNQTPELDEVAKFLFRGSGFAGAFRLVGSDYFREFNRTRSAVFAALDQNDNHLLELDEIDRADESLYQLDHNGDQRIDFNEVASLPENESSAWKNRRSSRWGEVAMDLSGYIDWQMLAYTLDESTRESVFGREQNVVAMLDEDSSGTIDVDEARSLLSIQPDARLRVRYPLAATGHPPEIEILSVFAGTDRHAQRTAAPNQVGIDGARFRWLARVIQLRTGRNQIPPEAFVTLDVNNDGGLDESEIPAVALREYSFEDLDQDQDGKLTLREINEGLSPKAPIWDVQIRSRGAESPDAVFCWLDQNQDDVLSTREVRGAIDRLRGIPRDQDHLGPLDIPESFVVQFGRGDPDRDDQLFALSAPSSDVPRSRPRWAESMDTNRDGDISVAEFVGTRSQFDILDKNSDGFIDTTEAL